ALSSNVHTYRLLIFKELYSVLRFAAIVLSAAKKKEYEAFSSFRQPSFFSFHSAFACVVLRGGEL
ncbi:hypothetical protein, partial [Duganella phyllosphaerae]|uniref:hypothetical protein n=1 Tax=Duganella phyllosphaerae TaxID=762836 RepID=UPI001ABF92EE